jgi:hypothetical protein
MGGSTLSDRLDTTRPHPARVYDHLLGGKDNFAPDRSFAEQVMAAYPAARTAAIENRGFMRRAVTHLVRDAGVRQFLDVGTGLPTSPNLHEVAQGIAPETKVVYVDNDPIVLVHARALLTSSAAGATAYVDADLREPDRILAAPDLLRTLDLSRPIALTMIAVLHFITDDMDPYGIVARLVRALPPGSYLVMSHGTWDPIPPETLAKMQQLRDNTAQPFNPRSAEEIARFFTGLDLVDPGIVPVAEWRADDEPQPRPAAADVAFYGAVARVP